jgi:hypothetical protein
MVLGIVLFNAVGVVESGNVLPQADRDDTDKAAMRKGLYCLSVLLA